MAKAAVRVKTYANRKGEQRVQISVSRDYAERLAGDDADVLGEVVEATRESLKEGWKNVETE